METEVKITGLAFGGKGVGRIGGKVVFVPFTAPGDEVRVRITAEKKGYSEGVMTGLISPSGLRVAPPCPVFGVCGGCALQHISYPGQVGLKEDIFEETIKRIGKASPADSFDRPAASPAEYNYRSRARLHVDGNGIGFFGAGSHSVVDIDSCPIIDPLLNEALRDIKGVLPALRAVVFEIELGVSPKEGRTIASFHVTGDGGTAWERLLSGVKSLKGFEVRLFRGGRGKRILSAGDLTLNYGVSGMDLSASISVFSQVNLHLNEGLVGKVAEYADLKGGERVLDLFSGVGNLSLPLARRARKVTGVETSRESVSLASGNATANFIENAGFFAGDALGWLKKNMKDLEKDAPDVVVLDPPRGGEPDVARAVAVLKPKRIVYVSCSPPTLARDIALLTGCGYRLVKAGLFDMFPQTYHIESIAGLELSARRD